MSGLTPEQYDQGRNHLIAIDQAMREKLVAAKTRCEGIIVASTTSFGTPKEMWVEAGVALGFAKPCILLVQPKPLNLPSAVYRCRVHFTHPVHNSNTSRGNTCCFRVRPTCVCS